MGNCGEKSSSPLSKINSTRESDSCVTTPRNFSGMAASGWESHLHNPAEKSRPANAWGGQKTL